MTPDSALMGVPWGIVADPLTGRIHVVDYSSSRVAIFERDGTFAGTLGRAGGGPGEFRNPVAAALDAHGAIAIWDAGRGIVSRWSGEGDLLNEERPDLAYWGPGFALGENRLVAVTSSTTGATQTQRLVVSTSEDTAIVHQIPITLTEARFPCGTIQAQKVFAPWLVWTARGDTILFVDAPAYRIDEYANGDLITSIRRDTRPIAATSDMAAAAVESGPGPYRGLMRRCPATATEIVTAVGYEEVVPPLQNIALDPAGRLWVTRTMNGVDPALIDVFSADGEYQGTMPAPGVPVAFPSSSSFVSLRLDETGAVRISLYDVLRTGSGSPYAAGSAEQ
ncbi:MAG TPA: 6-bladed beta-propeller [Longimicrobiales bacterium]|nr:6-bladed beta-propeller [Longimicrobiales bacterium]